MTSARSDRKYTESTNPDAAYREDFLRLLARLELEPGQAVALVEAATGRPFDTCSPMQLVPLLQQLPELMRSRCRPVDARQPWHA
jgi:hypothetical protein